MKFDIYIDTQNKTQNGDIVEAGDSLFPRAKSIFGGIFIYAKFWEGGVLQGGVKGGS